MLVDKWCYFFKHAADTHEADLPEIIGSDLIIQKAYDVLNQFNWSESELLAYEQAVKRMRDAIAIMEDQHDQGMAKGIAEAMRTIAQTFTGFAHAELKVLQEQL